MSERVAGGRHFWRVGVITRLPIRPRSAPRNISRTVTRRSSHSWRVDRLPLRGSLSGLRGSGLVVPACSRWRCKRTMLLARATQIEDELASPACIACKIVSL